MKKNKHKNYQENQQHVLNFKTSELSDWSWVVCSLSSAIHRELDEENCLINQEQRKNSLLMIIQCSKSSEEVQKHFSVRLIWKENQKNKKKTQQNSAFN